MIEIRHLKLLRAIVDEGGPTRAAARLHLSQSAVSHQLAELEGRLGVPLFARVRKKLVPTPAGARLLDESRTLLAEVARLERELYRGDPKKREPLRVVVETFTHYSWLAPMIDEVRIVLEAAREPVTALLKGAVDLAIVSSPVSDRTLHATPLFEDEWTVAMHKGHPLAQRPWVSAAELGKETVFAHDAPRSDVERLRDLVQAERAPMPKVINVPLTELMIELVRSGRGVALASRWACAAHATQIEQRRFTRKGLAETWTAYTRRELRDHPDVLRAIALLQRAA
jgi:LysR family transcriptional regulator, regulator for metE and metH